MKQCRRCQTTSDDEAAEIQQVDIFYVYHVFTCMDCMNEWEVYSRETLECIEWRKLKAEMDALLAIVCRPIETASYFIERYVDASQRQYELETLISQIAKRFYTEDTVKT